MQPFRIKLSNDGTVTGFHSIPPASAPHLRYRPLIVALHGGCYDSQYFKGIPGYSAQLSSEAFRVPFVAIDRPSYGGTSSILPVPEGTNFYQETGRWLHQYILPRIWSNFGVPNDCNCIVLLSHSLGVMGGIIAAALHAQDDAPLYPLGGFIASGMGNTQSPALKTSSPPFVTIEADHVRFPAETKDAVMFRPGTAAAEVLELCERLNATSPLADLVEFPTTWLPVWKETWASQVLVPVMFALVEDDPFFIADAGELDTCVRAFTRSVRVDGSLVRGAPHCMELGYWSQGWYARCFGFAMECAASMATH
ncbi:hypothetical protein ASPACDRAFT_55794 [Aspergillus aculeatus ATCC 16872]|uniref:AB hydrolase-1 domain-containing protein n=1 Tax=Aspergillus aculeatus (strain ATCC 16872 / CBS 172.66 / WB 5094) TaxID=690307 RepID=A0A1L9X794_ASPA1|nr:uncharacterized protein ASPACDRAFT_55794 [Aspergillus aculeatus ATCC 16872]OJK04297.1 hypothetical protein ASPACDRAFT_55794 [Aspergillus aculeatus ATCC 16872]